MIVAIIVTIIVVAIATITFAWCKVAGDCSRDEDNRIEK